MIYCRLILDRRRQRKWVIDGNSDKTEMQNLQTSISHIIQHGTTVSIGEKYVDKLKYEVGNLIEIDGNKLSTHGGGYLLYNDVVKDVVDKDMHIPNKNPISLEHDGVYLDNDMFNIFHRNIVKQVNTLILGPTGTLKTEIMPLIASKLDIECTIYDMGAMHDPIAGLLGVHRLEKGESVFDYAKFVQDVQKPGIIVLDELNRAPQGAMNILYPCLDRRRMLPVEVASSKVARFVPVHPQCVFIATANVGAEYTGTNTIDKALLNRFFLVEMPYLKPNIESLLLTKRTGIDIETAKIIAKIANELRSHNKNGKISQSVSTRETIMIGELISDGWTALDAMKACILPLYDEGDRDFVLKLILGK